MERGREGMEGDVEGGNGHFRSGEEDTVGNFLVELSPPRRKECTCTGCKSYAAQHSVLGESATGYCLFCLGYDCLGGVLLCT